MKPYTIIASFIDSPSEVSSLHETATDPYEARHQAKRRLVLGLFGYENEEHANRKDEEFNLERECEDVLILYTFEGHLESID